MIDLLKNCQKLIVSIVNQNKSAKLIRASRRKHAEGATILRGVGTSGKSFWGIPMEPVKDVVLTVISDEHAEEVLDIISKSVKMGNPGNGIAFILDITKFTGAVHIQKKKIKPKDQPLKFMDETSKFDLIVTIVNKGFGDQIIDATKDAGAAGGTVISGRGTGVHEYAKLFSISIEPEKEVILTLVPDNMTRNVLEAIVKNGELDKPGKGISFVLNVEKVAGINHLLGDVVSEKNNN